MDEEAARLALRLEDAHAKRVQIALDAAGMDREIESFTSSGSLDAKAASKLVGRQTEASNLLILLDRSIEHLTRELAAAKVDVLKAERECISAQRNHHAAIVDQLCRQFLRLNADTIQKIVRGAA